jgi:hypothetical protein
LAEVNVVAPVEDPSRIISLLVNVCAPVQVFAWPSAREATTAPVVGEIVTVPSLFDTDDTVAPPAHEPHTGAAFDPDSRHWLAVPVPDRRAKAEPDE